LVALINRNDALARVPEARFDDLALDPDALHASRHCSPEVVQSPVADPRALVEPRLRLPEAGIIPVLAVTGKDAIGTETRQALDDGADHGRDRHRMRDAALAAIARDVDEPRL